MKTKLFLEVWDDNTKQNYLSPKVLEKRVSQIQEWLCYQLKVIEVWKSRSSKKYQK